MALNSIIFSSCLLLLLYVCNKQRRQHKIVPREERELRLLWDLDRELLWDLDRELRLLVLSSSFFESGPSTFLINTMVMERVMDDG
jgi:hypothetical protein